MSLYDLLADRTEDADLGGRILGVVPAVVTNNQDPDGMGRVKVRFPWLGQEDESHWARSAVSMAGADRGTWFLPEVGDEVLVAFEQGDPRFPYVVGALWNGKDAPPADNADGENAIRVVRSRSGHEIRFDDSEGAEKLEVRDAHGNRVLFDSASDTIEIEAAGDLTLTAGGRIRLEARDIELSSSAATKAEAGTQMELTASATLDVQGSIVNIN